MKRCILVCLSILLTVGSAAADDVTDGNPYGKWANGPSAEPGYFPIAVWLQSPRLASKYQALGINLYVGLWKGPTEAQLAALEKAGMPVVCAQNEVGLRHKDNATIVGWMHGDEPDNARWLKAEKRYGPPVPPAKIVAAYRRLRKRDPTRPVLLNLGQGAAWDGWRGRGVRTNHPEDYPDYLRGCDIAGFDIYPACHSRPEVAGKLWYVARGVERLRGWTKKKKPVWCCIECTHINNPKARATPAQVKGEVWMAITHGAQGLIYFSHQFKPKFIEAGLLADRAMAEAVGKVNRQILALAPVLNSPTVKGAIRVTTDKETPIHTLVKRHGRDTYIFAVAMRGNPAEATFRLASTVQGKRVSVVGEERTLDLQGREFRDRFAAWGVHIYRIVR